MILKYIKEISNLKFYIFLLLTVIIASYSVFIFFDVPTISRLGEEDNFFEWLTVIYLAVAAIICFILFIKKRNIFFLLFFLVFVFGAGEEISWGQRIVGIETPESIKEKNVQDEFNIHNLEYFTQHSGIARLMSMNFLFRLFTLVFGVVLPLCMNHLKFCRVINQKLKLPIPPLSIGVFFLINWVLFRILHRYILPHDFGVQYIDTAGEIFESLGAFILLVIFSYFYFENPYYINRRYKAINT
jgi:hypothetical protein